jgi:type VI secretion system protein ImpC
VQNLPTHTFKTDDGDLTVKCPTEIAITDRREKELSDLGLIALCYQKNSDKSAFFGGSTVNLPKKYNQDAATANAFLSAQLQYVFSASRFAHYLKVIARDKIGSFTTVTDFQSYLEGWIKKYIIVGNASFDEKVKHPLSGASIAVTEIAGKPGSYKAVAHIQPHLQLEELDTSIRLVANLDGGGE